MSIFISNDLFIAGPGGDEANINNPLIGYHSVLLPSDISAEEDVGAPTNLSRNMWTPDTYSFWEGPSISASPVAVAEHFIFLSNAVGRPIDYIGIAKHNLANEGYEYTLQQSTDGGTTWTNISSPRIITTNDAILHYFNTTTARLFRVRLYKTRTGSPGVIFGPIISHIKLGQVLILQRRIYVGHAPATLSKMVSKISNGSESGQYLGQIVKRSYYKSSCTQENNTPTFVREKIVPFINHINGDVVINGTAPATFFYAWRPGDYPNEVVYGWTNDTIKPKNSANDKMGGRMTWDFDMECIV